MVDLCRVSQLPLLEDAALLPEDRDVAEERKRVLECQPMVESMMGSPLILQELSKVRSAGVFFFPLSEGDEFVSVRCDRGTSLLLRCTAAGRICWLLTV